MCYSNVCHSNNVLLTFAWCLFCSPRCTFLFGRRCDRGQRTQRRGEPTCGDMTSLVGTSAVPCKCTHLHQVAPQTLRGSVWALWLSNEVLGQVKPIKTLRKMQQTLLNSPGHFFINLEELNFLFCSK